MNWLQHDINERKVMLQEVADSIHLPVLYVDYESISDNSSPYMPSRVKIEISSLSMREPFEMREISSMIRGVFFKDDDIAACVIPVVLPGRTFLEKAFLLCEEFQKQNPRSLRMSRHLYDLEKLMNTPFGEKALSDMVLYKTIVEHRRKFYHVSYADYDKNYPPYITIIPPNSHLMVWKQDYLELQKNFIYGNSLEFEEIIKRLKVLQEMLRSRHSCQP